MWLPPPSMSVSPQGYLPGQLYNLDASKYGTLAELKVRIPAQSTWDAVPHSMPACMVHPHAWHPVAASIRPQAAQVLDIDAVHAHAPHVQDLVSSARKLGIAAIADIVINHRCADEQTDGVYNRYRDDVTHKVGAACSLRLHMHAHSAGPVWSPAALLLRGCCVRLLRPTSSSLRISVAGQAPRLGPVGYHVRRPEVQRPGQPRHGG